MSIERDAIRSQLLDIRDRCGDLTAETAHAEAERSPGSPLHSYLLWDDAQAGYLHRLEQIRGLIRKYKIVTREATEDQPKREVREFVAIRTVGKRHTYEPLREVAADPVKREILLRDMERDWRMFWARWSKHAEFVGAMVSMIREDLDALNGQDAA